MRKRISFFFVNDTATTEIYTLSLHDALPICRPPGPVVDQGQDAVLLVLVGGEHVLDEEQPQPERDHLAHPPGRGVRSEEHTSELQSRQYLVCRLLLEKNKNDYIFVKIHTMIK